MAVDFEKSDLYEQMHAVFFGSEDKAGKSKEEVSEKIVTCGSRSDSDKWPTREELEAIVAKEPVEPIKGGIRIERGGHWVPNIGGPGRHYVYPRIKGS